MREICGDVSATNRLSKKDKAVYFLSNLVRGVWGHRIWLKTKRFDLITVLPLQTSDSPMRYLLDHVFDKIILQYVTKDEISVFDIGAGSAYFRARLAALGKHGTYTGLDVYTHAHYQNDAVPAFDSNLIISKIEDVSSNQVYDLVMSITALEHIADDTKAVTVSRSLTNDSGVEVHIAPSFLSLFLYLWHGYRQYTPKRIKDLFKGSNYTVYRLGGWGSFLVHWLCITLPERILGLPSIRRYAFYSTFLKIGFFIDRIIPVGSIAYVVVVTKKHD